MTADLTSLAQLSDVQRKLLVAAERLFAERGVAHVSLREIGAAAAQRNNSVVQYHFKNKECLIVALYDFRLIPLNQHRLALLAEREHHTMRDLVEAFIRPLGSAVIDAAGGNSYARFIHRYLSEGTGDFEPFDERHSSGVAAIVAELRSRLNQMPEPTLSERIRQLNQLATSVLADLERRLEHGQTTRTEATAAVESLIVGATAFITAT